MCLFLMLAGPKFVKAAILYPSVGPQLFAPLVIPDLLFASSAELMFIAVYSFVLPYPRPAWRKALSTLWTFFLVFAGIYSASELRFFQATGSFMDAAMFLHGLRYFDQLFGVIRAEMSIQWGGAIVLCLLIGLAMLRLGLRYVGISLSRRVAAAVLVVLTVSQAGIARHIDENRSSHKLSPLESTLLWEQLILTQRRLVESQKTVDLSYPIPERVQVTETPETHKKNVVLILLESTRFNATTPYNPALDTTPNLARIASEGARAERAYVTLPHTTKALVSVLSGYPPDIRRPLSETTEAGVPGTGLATILKPIGYSSAFFHSSFGNFENNDVLVRNLGFDTYSAAEQLDRKAWESPNYLGVEDRAMTAPVLSWVDEQKSPFLLTILTLVSHHDYKVPTTFATETYEGSERLSSYLNAVRYVDGFVGEVFKGFEQRGLLDNTIFVILGDHGEGHGEHGRKGHDQIMYEEGIRIPFVVFDRGKIQAGTVIDGLRYNLDVVPTVLDLLGLQVTRGKLEGLSLLKSDENRVLHASCWIEDQCVSRLWGNHKFIHYYGKQSDEYFDLTADPQESNNLIETLPKARREEFTKDILDWKSHIRRVYETYSLRKSEGYATNFAPDVTERLNATFEPSLEVIGFDVSEPLMRGKEARLTLWVLALKNLVGGWKIDGEMLNTAGQPHGVQLVRTAPDIEPESYVPGVYYRIEYRFKVLPRAPVGRTTLRLSVQAQKGQRRSVKGINVDREARVVEIPVRVEE